MKLKRVVELEKSVPVPIWERRQGKKGEEIFINISLYGGEGVRLPLWVTIRPQHTLFHGKREGEYEAIIESDQVDRLKPNSFKGRGYAKLTRLSFWDFV